MKKAIAFLLFACLLLSAAGCSAPTPAEILPAPEAVTFPIDTYHLQITADSTFREDTGGSYDLQITNDRCYISIMAYGYIDLPEGVTPMDVYDMQNSDLLSKRSAVSTIEESSTQSLSGRTVTQTLYSAEKDGVKNYYAAYLVDLPDAETLAWVLVSAAPSYLKANRDALHDIVCSLTAAE